MRPDQLRIFPTLVILIASLALTGCEVGPTYEIPRTAQFYNKHAQGSFVGSTDNTVIQDGPLSSGWWRLYRSDELDRLVEAGFVANTDLRLAEANLKKSESMIALAKSQRQPQLGFGGTYQRSLLSAESYLSPEGDLPPMNLYALELSASYEVDLFGRIRRGVEAAQADEESVQAARDWVRVTVAARITRDYLEVCSDGDELAVTQHSAALQQQSLALTRRLQTEGRATQLDVTRSQGLVDQLLSAIPDIEARRRNALYQLAVLTGRTPSEFDEGLTRCNAVPPIVQPIPIGNGTALLKRRPDVRAAERQLAAATARIGVATADLYPRIVLKGSIGSTGTASDFLQHSTNEWSLGPFVSWQLNQSATRAKISAANAGQQGQLARFDGTVLNALREVEVALNNYQHDIEREELLALARDESLKAAADSHQLELVGRSNEFATLDAERTLASAQASLAFQRSRVAADQVDLFMALGGGWETSAHPTAAAEG